MSTVIFEQPYRGNVWRLELAEFNGRRFYNWRRWYLKDGELFPTRDGCTIPIERLPELLAALANSKPDGTDNT